MHNLASLVEKIRQDLRIARDRGFSSRGDSEAAYQHGKIYMAEEVLCALGCEPYTTGGDHGDKPSPMIEEARDLAHAKRMIEAFALCLRQNTAQANRGLAWLQESRPFDRTEAQHQALMQEVKGEIAGWQKALGLLPVFFGLPTEGLPCPAKGQEIAALQDAWRETALRARELEDRATLSLSDPEIRARQKRIAELAGFTRGIGLALSLLGAKPEPGQEPSGILAELALQEGPAPFVDPQEGNPPALAEEGDNRASQEPQEEPTGLLSCAWIPQSEEARALAKEARAYLKGQGWANDGWEKPLSALAIKALAAFAGGNRHVFRDRVSRVRNEDLKQDLEALFHVFSSEFAGAEALLQEQARTNTQKAALALSNNVDAYGIARSFPLWAYEAQSQDCAYHALVCALIGKLGHAIPGEQITWGDPRIDQGRILALVGEIQA